MKCIIMITVVCQRTFCIMGLQVLSYNELMHSESKLDIERKL